MTAGPTVHDTRESAMSEPVPDDVIEAIRGRLTSATPGPMAGFALRSDAATLLVEVDRLRSSVICDHDLGMRPGAALIAAERQRQIEAEGYTTQHDAEHADESLALAACSYAIPPTWRRFKSWRVPVGDDETRVRVPTTWPWPPRYWKPTPNDRVRELVKAGALIAAEIDRLAEVSS